MYINNRPDIFCGKYSTQRQTEYKCIGTKARYLICSKDHRESKHCCRQTIYNAVVEVNCRTTIVRCPNCKGVPEAISNKCEIAREATAKSRIIGASRKQKNPNTKNRREDGQVGSYEIETSQDGRGGDVFLNQY